MSISAPTTWPARRLWTVAAVCLLLFGVLTALVAAHWTPLLDADRSWDTALHRTAVQHSGWSASMRMVATIGSPAVLRILLAVVAAWLWVRGARLTAVWVAAVGVVEAVVELVAKSAVGRARPAFPNPVSHATGAAYPSGHAMTVATVGPLLLLLVWPHLGPRGRAAATATTTVAVLAVSWTRIGLGVHWPSDVLGGWLLAAVVLSGVTAAFENLRPGALGREVGAVRLQSTLRVQSATAPERPKPPPER